MESRKEPRFRTDAVALLEVIRDKAYTFEVRVKNVSALGFQIEMAESLNLGETIRLAFEGYHLFAQVHHCGRSGSAFTIGAERVDQWDGTVGEGTAMSTVITRPLSALGRPVLKNPVGRLRGAALRELFANARPRTKGANYPRLGGVGRGIWLMGLL